MKPKRTSRKREKKKKKRQKEKDATPMAVDKKRKQDEVDRGNQAMTSGESKKKKLVKHESSKFSGINKLGDMFMATIRYPESRGGSLQRLGTFKSPETAALAYDIGAYNLQGSQAVLNFPDAIRTGMMLRHKARPKSSDDGKLKGEEKKDEHEVVEMFTLGKFLGIKKSGDKFMATLRYPASLSPHRKGMLFMGSYDSPETAALAYDIAAYFLHGFKAVLNFPGAIDNVKGLPAELARAKGKLKEEKKDEHEVVELFTLGKFRGIQKSRGDKFMALLKYPPSLAARREGMLFVGTYDSPETAALAHDIAAYHLHGSRAIFNFPDVTRTTIGLRALRARAKMPSSDDGQNT